MAKQDTRRMSGKVSPLWLFTWPLLYLASNNFPLESEALSFQKFSVHVLYHCYQGRVSGQYVFILSDILMV